MFTRMRKIKAATTKISCVLLFSSIGQAALAFDVTSDGKFPLNDELCDPMISTIANLTMLRRQKGEPLSKVMSDAENSDRIFGLNGTARDMALAAYDSPKYSVAGNKTEAADDFANEWVLACYKAQR